MKIEPVYLLSPLPVAPSMPTRRAILIAAGAFAAGSLIGGACGYSMGVLPAPADPGVGPAPTAPVGEIEQKPSGDIEFDYWRKLAVKAPLDELFAEASDFLAVRVSKYPKDEILWLGVERLAIEMVNNTDRWPLEMDVAVVAAQIEGLARPENRSLRELVPALRARRKALRTGK